MESNSDTWNITIDDTSPLFKYSPYSDVALPSNGWSAYFEGLGYNNQTGEGSQDRPSLHYTSLSGAQVTLQFDGTAISIYGSSNASYQVTVDNTQQSPLTPSGDLLYAAMGLTPGAHFVTLTAHPTAPDQMLGIDMAVVGIPTGKAGRIPTPVVYDNSDPKLLYQGSWTVARDPQIPNSTNPVPYHKSQTKGDTVSMSFSGASAVAINGSTEYGNWLYSVTLDGAETTYNSSGFWLVPDTMLFFESDLDPDASHILNVTNIAGDGMMLWINSITVFETDSSSVSHGSSNAGIIAGPIVGVFAFTALMALGLWWWRKRRLTASGFCRTGGDVLGSEPGSSTVVPFNVHSMTVPHASNLHASSSFTSYDANRRSGKQGALQRPTPPPALPESNPSCLLSPPAHAVSVPSSPGIAEEPGDISLGSFRPLPILSRGCSANTQAPPPQARDPLLDASGNMQPPVDEANVNRLLEIIAARMDRPESNQTSLNAAPPEYRG